MLKFTRASLALASLCLLNQAAALTFDFPLQPRLTLSATSGSNTFGVGEAMLPFWGDANQILYGDVEAKIGDDQAWLASIGFGGRQVYLDRGIFGAYLFADYNHTRFSNHFTVLNPGVEFMDNEWDAHLNGYFPLSARKKLLATYSGTQLGLPTFFSGHAEYDNLFYLKEVVASGVDAEVGYIVPDFYTVHRGRAFVGAYHFSLQHGDNINGIEGGFEFPIIQQPVVFEVRDSYDRVQKNTLVLTVRFNFGGVEKPCVRNVHDRMVDPIQRHLADLNNGAGIPSEAVFIRKTNPTPVLTNIWFFTPDDTIATFASTRTASMVTSEVRTHAVPISINSCTFEHPCSGLSQTRIDTINALAPLANFYLSPGTYNNPNVGSGFHFRYGQNVSGRTLFYQDAATGSVRPWLMDSLLLDGANNIANVQVNGQTTRSLDTGFLPQPHTVGILAQSASGMINLTNLNVIASSSTQSAIGIANSSNLDQMNIAYSTITTSVIDVPDGEAIGVGNLRLGMLNMNNDIITAVNSNTVPNFGQSFGVVNNAAGMMNIANSNISATLNHGDFVAGVINNSTFGFGVGTVSIVSSHISASGDDVGLTAGVFNQANNFFNVGGDVVIDHSVLTANSINSIPGDVTGSAFTTGSGQLSIHNSLLNASADDGTVSGILVSPTGNAIFGATRINVVTSGPAVGSPTNNAGGILTDEGDNACFLNGVQVPCS